MADEQPAKHGATVKDVPAAEYIKALSAHFKKTNKIEVPEWHDLVKTGSHKELAPYDPDWFYVRAASIARKVYLRGGLGVGGLSRTYGGNLKKGVFRRHFHRSAKGVIRHIMQALQEADIISKKDDRKGRWLTSNGRRELDIVAGQVVLKAE